MEDELSGKKWEKKFLGSADTKDLARNFRLAVEDFLFAMTESGIKVVISATYRPPKRSYLMHYAWRIAKKQIDVTKVPKMPGVNIKRDHGSDEQSVKAAKEMLPALNISNLTIKPAIRSRHNAGLAIDMSLSWSKTIEIMNARGDAVKISALPRNGLNKQLIAVGKTYGVQKFRGHDDPHWSDNGL
jgi:hypothetical protein